MNSTQWEILYTISTTTINSYKLKPEKIQSYWFPNWFYLVLTWSTSATGRCKPGGHLQHRNDFEKAIISVAGSCSMTPMAVESSPQEGVVWDSITMWKIVISRASPVALLKALNGPITLMYLARPPSTQVDSGALNLEICPFTQLRLRRGPRICTFPCLLGCNKPCCSLWGKSRNTIELFVISIPHINPSRSRPQ